MNVLSKPGEGQLSFLAVFLQDNRWCQCHLHHLRSYGPEDGDDSKLPPWLLWAVPEFDRALLRTVE